MDCSNRTSLHWIGLPAAFVSFLAVPGFRALPGNGRE